MRGGFRNRAFVMPLVVLMALVTSMMVAVLLNRNSVRRSDAEWALNSYVEEHRQRGVREILAVWLQFSAQQDFESMLASDGTAFTLDYSGGRRLVVRLLPAQGAPVIDPEGVDVDQATNAALSPLIQRQIVERTAEILGSRSELLGRRSGPIAVSLYDASPEVIRAVTRAVMQNDQLAEEYANQLIRRRDDSEAVDTQALLMIARDLEVPDNLQTQLSGIWTTLPALWSARVELTGPGADGRDEVIGRYEALVFIPREETTSPLLTGSEHPSAWFLEWRKLDEGVGYTPIPGLGAY